MTEFSKLATIILPASLCDAGNQAALQFDPIGGNKTFREPFLSTDGKKPATYTAASGLMTEPTFSSVNGMISMFPGSALYEAMPALDAIKQHGLKVISEIPNSVIL